MDQRSNVKAETVKILEENFGIDIYNPRFGCGL